MPRHPRVHAEGLLYHVMARGNDGQKIFLRQSDYQVRIPLKSASDSEANRPPLWSKAARGSERSDAGVFVIA
jgi:hypothetical protein